MEQRGPGKAAHCVIVGFAAEEVQPKYLFEYEHIKGSRSARRCGGSILPGRRGGYCPRQSFQPLCTVPAIGIGNKPIDGGYYLFTGEEMSQFVQREPQAASYFRRWLGSVEFLNGFHRYCLWLGDCPPETLRTMPEKR